MLITNLNTKEEREWLLHLKKELEYWEGMQLEKEVLMQEVPYKMEDILNKQRALIKKIRRLKYKILKMDNIAPEPRLAFFDELEGPKYGKSTIPKRNTVR